MTITNDVKNLCLCGETIKFVKNKQCKKCYQKDWYQKNKEKILKKNKTVEFEKSQTPLDPTEDLCIKCGGRFPYCNIKMCNSCYKKTNYQKHKSKILEQARTPKGRFDRAKVRAKEKSMIFSLSEDLYCSLIKMPCNYCLGYFPATVAGIGLDRLDNTRGYEADNVVSACGTCNQLRMDVFTPEETKIMVKAVILNRTKRDEQK